MQIYYVLDMLTKPTKAYKPIRKSYNINIVCLLHVSANFSHPQGGALQTYVQNVSELMYKWKIPF